MLVVEADLRRPKLTPRLNLSGNGLSEILAGIATADESIHTIEVVGNDGATIATKIDVIPAGLVPPSPLALLEGDNASKLFAELRERYDVVLVDNARPRPSSPTPSHSPMPWTASSSSRDSALCGRTPYKRLREILSGIDKPVIGQIVNGDRAAGSYGYYSTYAPKHSKKAKNTA